MRKNNKEAIIKWQQKRFGMFIHWGLYALPARHEWIMMKEEIDPKSYENKYFKHFNPRRYDPEKWAKQAKSAGMKYFVITAKHHEGFCLWDSKYTDYKVTNTPYGKDVLSSMIDAFRKEGLGVGIYYSLIDWHHPHFTIDRIHPLRNHPDAVEMNKNRDISIYRQYLHNQVEELMTEFGKIDELWFDFSYETCEYWSSRRNFEGKGKEEWGSEKLIEMIRSHQPEIIINDRLQIEQDIKTPEQHQPQKPLMKDGKPVVWEACQTFSGSWGYFRDEMTWKSPEQLIEMLINTVACGGNLLMNVGPTAQGFFDKRAINALQEYVDWMEPHSDSIYGCGVSKFPAPKNCAYTQKGNKLYLHIFCWPFKHLHAPELAGRIEYAQFLHDGSEITFNEPDPELEGHGHTSVNAEGSTVIFNLPVIKPEVTIPVIEIFLTDISNA